MMCPAALQTPALPLVEIDVEQGENPGECPGGTDRTGDAYVKLSEGVFHWHLYDQGGLYAVPEDELGRIEYKHCPEFLNRN